MKLYEPVRDAWTLTCYDDNNNCVVFKCDSTLHSLMFNYVHILHPIPDTPEEQCKMFLNKCFKLAQEQVIYLCSPVDVDWSIKQFMSKGMTLEQVLIDMDLKAI